jgi:hypothetical protein
VINWSGFERKRPWPNGILSRQFPGRTEENHESFQSGQSVSQPRFESSVTKYKSRALSLSYLFFIPEIHYLMSIKSLRLLFSFSMFS